MGYSLSEARIEILAEKKLVGKRLKMSLLDNRTFDLWRSFMPRRKEILNTTSDLLFSLQIYADERYFQKMNPNAPFEKWAAREVTDFAEIPQGMETLILSGGLYAVFLYKGTTQNAAEVFQYIFETWLPNSAYLLDNRPHFELLGEKYMNNDPSSEEEIWIPIKEKAF